VLGFIFFIGNDLKIVGVILSFQMVLAIDCIKQIMINSMPVIRLKKV